MNDNFLLKLAMAHNKEKYFQRNFNEALKLYTLNKEAGNKALLNNLIKYSMVKEGGWKEAGNKALLNNLIKYSMVKEGGWKEIWAAITRFFKGIGGENKKFIDEILKKIKESPSKINIDKADFSKLQHIFEIAQKPTYPTALWGGGVTLASTWGVPYLKQMIWGKQPKGYGDFWKNLTALNTDDPRVMLTLLGGAAALGYLGYKYGGF